MGEFKLLERSEDLLIPAYTILVISSYLRLFWFYFSSLNTWLHLIYCPMSLYLLYLLLLCIWIQRIYCYYVSGSTVYRGQLLMTPTPPHFFLPKLWEGGGEILQRIFWGCDPERKKNLKNHIIFWGITSVVTKDNIIQLSQFFALYKVCFLFF